jgi:hypothetical protein
LSLTHLARSTFPAEDYFDAWLNGLEYVIAHEGDHHLKHTKSGVTDKDGHLLDPTNEEVGAVDPYHTLNSRACSNAGWNPGGTIIT